MAIVCHGQVIVVIQAKRQKNRYFSVMVLLS